MQNQTRSDACYVCGETKNTGWHFGTITCEACKKFFIRNFECESEAIKCVRNNQNCVITKSTRANCPSCRFKKCQQVGMDPSEKNSTSQAISFKDISCSICGDASSGLHFGAITCEGCKGFFRRSANDGVSFECKVGGNCEINTKTRNGCRACRYKRCLEKEMSLTNSKIGRQSNLFKQKLLSDKAMNVSSIENTKLVQPHNQYSSADSRLLASDNQPDIEDALEPQLKSFVKNVYQAYMDSFGYDLYSCDIQQPTTTGFNDEHLPLGYYHQDFQEFNHVFKFLDCHFNKCISFLQKSMGSFQSINPADQVKILANGVHTIRLLQLASHQQSINYFNSDDHTFQKLCRVFPIFNTILPYLKSLNELIRAIKLDAKEFALYSALIAFSSAGRGLTMIKDYYGLNLEICRALMAYMKLRRNECESCELLIHFGFRFEKINIQLQSGIYEAFKRMETNGQRASNTFCMKIIYSPFENFNV